MVIDFPDLRTISNEVSVSPIWLGLCLLAGCSAPVRQATGVSCYTSGNPSEHRAIFAEA